MSEEQRSVFVRESGELLTRFRRFKYEARGTGSDRARRCWKTIHVGGAMKKSVSLTAPTPIDLFPSSGVPRSVERLRDRLTAVVFSLACLTVPRNEALTL